MLLRYMGDESLSDVELDRLAAVDRSLRFFYLCTVLHHDLKIEQDVVARSYYWFASQLLDRERRPELYRYVSTHYRRLHDWLLRHEPCFRGYQERGVWDPGLARSDDEVRALHAGAAG